VVWKRGGRKSIFEGVGTEAGYEDKNRNEDKELLGPTLRGLCWSSLKKKWKDASRNGINGTNRTLATNVS